jgi:hypothetical protein
LPSRFIRQDRSDQVVVRKPDASSLAVSRWIDTEHCAASRRELVDRNHVHTGGLWAVDREYFDLPGIGTPRHPGIAVMPIRAAGRKAHGSHAQPTRLALDATKTLAIVNDEVVASVLAERYRDGVTEFAEHEHHRKCRLVADVLWMIHDAQR